MKILRRPSPYAKRRMKRIRNIRARRQNFKWHPEFAFLPVRVNDDTTATAEYRWLEDVYVSRYFDPGSFFSRAWEISVEQYSALSPGQKSFDDPSALSAALRAKSTWRYRRYVEKLPADELGPAPAVPARETLGLSDV